MATIKFTDYPRLERAVNQAEREVEKEKTKNVEGSHALRYAEERLEKVKALKELYDFALHGAIYIDLSDVNIIKRFSVQE